MTSKQNKFYGTHFRADRGVRKDDIVLPTIFNTIIDAVIRANEEEMKNETKTTIIFNTDDGFIGEFDHKMAQNTLDSYTKIFQSFSLIMNAKKTRTMTLIGIKSVHCILEESYHQQITKEVSTCQQKQQTIIQCKFCKEEMQTKSIKQHHLSKQFQEEKQKFLNNQQETMYRPMTPSSPGNPLTIEMPMDNQNSSKCPHTEYPYQTHNRERMMRRFRSRHANAIIIIQQEGLLPQCENCGLF